MHARMQLQALAINGTSYLYARLDAIDCLDWFSVIRRCDAFDNIAMICGAMIENTGRGPPG